ncbi:anti-sigma factor [Nocardioides houyundeii]|uniref:anti-sigma factor n=1 Tax=Nocardioides houyundeii TaxID=2045452 RepID=UPI000DF226B4|nr:anti-sigma factor [Nocardioides houyundeii]
MPHVDDQVIAALALGDADDLPPAEVEAAQVHLLTCEACRNSLAQLRETFDLVRASADDVGVAPPDHVWAAISAEIARETQVPEGSAQLLTATPEPTPEAPSADAPRPATGTTGTPAGEVVSLDRRRRSVPAWLAATAAVVTLTVGLGGGMILANGSDDETPPAASVVGTAELASLDDRAAARGQAQVRRHDDRVVLHVEAQKLGDPDGIREVWLINLDGSRMVSLGLLARGEAGDFEFPEELLDEGYRIVDISAEPDDGDPVHSGESLARGTLEG